MLLLIIASCDRQQLCILKFEYILLSSMKLRMVDDWNACYTRFRYLCINLVLNSRRR